MRPAHAWVEIFVEDYGWVPVEVTPLAGDTPQVSYPGFDASILQNLSDVSVTFAGCGGAGGYLLRIRPDL